MKPRVGHTHTHTLNIRGSSPIGRSSLIRGSSSIGMFLVVLVNCFSTPILQYDINIFISFHDDWTKSYGHFPFKPALGKSLWLITGMIF